VIRFDTSGWRRWPELSFIFLFFIYFFSGTLCATEKRWGEHCPACTCLDSWSVSFSSASFPISKARPNIYHFGYISSMNEFCFFKNKKVTLTQMKHE
jgi:hypothetical protein